MSKDLTRCFETKLKEANNLLQFQKDRCKEDSPVKDYLEGLYNGMEIIISVFEEREPKFLKE
jgi:hypothetical protein